jgi:pimeloyl-ACP methyl ester carboxylesterase
MEDAWTSPDTPDEVRAGLYDLVAGLIIGDPEAAAPWVARWHAERIDRTLPAFGALVGRDDVSDRLGEITCPALVVHGDADAAIALDRSRAMAAGLGDCRDVVVVAGAGHAANVTHPEPTNAAILDFLRSLPS